MKRWLKSLYKKLPLLRELTSGIELLNEVRGSISGLRSDLNALAFEAMMSSPDLFARRNEFGRLLNYGHRVCSQNGEDGMIREIFRRIGITNRTFCEIGIGDGIENNTAFLLSQGWRGVWVDGSPKYLQESTVRRWVTEARLKEKCTFVTRENVMEILKQCGVEKEFDLLSLDIDQNTYWIWEALSELSPRVVVVEYNSVLPADADWKVGYSATKVWDGSINFGAGLKAFEELGNRSGYKLVGCDFLGINAFFVRADQRMEAFCAPFTAENHYEPPRYTLAHRATHRPALLE